MFDGFFQLDSTARGAVIVRNPSNAPLDADALPSFRVYGPSGLMAGQNGTCEAEDTGVITGAIGTPIVITSAGHGRVTGDRVQVSGVGGNTSANGIWTVTVLDSNTFSLNGSATNATYTSGGSWHNAGIYTYSVDVTTNNGFEAGKTYSVEISCQIGGFPWAESHTFIVS